MNKERNEYMRHGTLKFLQIFLFTDDYLYILILEYPLIHTSYINIQIEDSLGLSPHMHESVIVACTSAC